MNFEPKSELKRDGLKITRFMGSGLYQFVFIKFLLVLILLIVGSFHLIQCYWFLSEFNAELFIQYGPLFFLLCYGLLAAVVLLLKPRIVHDLLNEISTWDIDSSTKTTQRNIKMEMKLIETFTIINTIASLCLFYFFYINDENYDRLSLAVKLINAKLPKYSPILSKIYKLSAYSLIAVYQTHCYQMIYCTQHVKYQLTLLFEHINEIMDFPQEFVLRHVHPIDNPSYQSRIKFRLIFLIRRHQEILMAGNKTIGEISNLIVWFSLSGVLAGVSNAFRAIKMSDDLIESIQIALTCTYGGLIAAAIILAGQSIETLTGNVTYTLDQVDWYNMNCENRKLFLVFLVKAQKRMSIKFSENYSINLALGVKIARGIYAVMSLLASLKVT